MLGTRDESRLKLLGIYFNVIAATALSAVALVLFLLQHDFLYRYLRGQDLQNIVMLIGMAGIVLVFLLFNTSYYALISYRRRRMGILSAAFLGAGFIQLMGIIHGYPNLGQAPDAVFQEVVYGSFPRMIISFGVLAGAMMSNENPMYGGQPKLIKFLPVAAAALIVWFDQWLGGIFMTLQPGTDLRFIELCMEYAVAGAYVLAVVFHLRSDSHKRNTFILQAASGYIVLIFAQGLQISHGLPPALTNIAFQCFQLAGFSIFFISVFRNNIDIPLAELVNAEKQITLYAENLEKIVERRTSEIRQVNARFIQEMDYARSIQQSLLPLKRLNFKKVTFYSEYYPCERLSGDFYDIYRIDDEHIGMYVLDVSGHGISAALMTMFCNNYIKSTERLIKRYRGLKPHRNLKHFYEEFNKMNFPEEMHMVIFFASYNLTTQVLTYSSGGMNCNPILIRQDGTWEYLDKSPGFPICKLSDFFQPEYTSEFIHLQDGDRLIFYTDGLVDKDKNNIFDEEELVSLMLENREKPVKVLNRMLTERIGKYAAQLDDDVTYFIMDIGM